MANGLGSVPPSDPFRPAQNGLGSVPPSDPFRPAQNGLGSPLKYKQESGWSYDPDLDKETYIPSEDERLKEYPLPAEEWPISDEYVAARDETWREEGRATIQDFLISVGMDKHAARNFAESTLGNPASAKRFGLGLADVTGLDIAYMGQEGVLQAQRGVATGDIGEAAVGSGIAALSAVPFGVVLGRALKSLAGQNYIKKTAKDFTKRWQEGKSPIPIGMTIEDVGIGHNLGPPLEKILSTKKPKADIDELGFYSVAGRVIDELPLFKHQQVAPGDQVLKAIIKRGATKEEIHELGLAKFLEGKKRVTQKEVQDYFKANQVKLSEVVLRDKGDLTKLEWGDISFISGAEYKAKKTKSILDTLEFSPLRDDEAMDVFDKEFYNIYEHMHLIDNNKYPRGDDPHGIGEEIYKTISEGKKTDPFTAGIEYLDPTTKKDFLKAMDNSIKEDIDLVNEANGRFELIKSNNGQYEIFGVRGEVGEGEWNTISYDEAEGFTQVSDTLEEAKIQTQAYETDITIRGEGEARWKEVEGVVTTSPGGENYEELLLTVPRRPDSLLSPIVAKYGGSSLHSGPRNYNDPHYPDIEDNIIAHLRTTKRDNVKVEGEIIETLHAEEIQSKLHSAGRKHGYVQEPPPITEEIEAKLDRYYELKERGVGWAIAPAAGPRRTYADAIAEEAIITEEWRELNRELAPWLKRQSNRIADLPFKETWHEMLFNRLVYKAIKEGKNSVSWTVGSTQADRYGDERLIPFYDKKLTGYAQTFSNKHGGGQVTKGSFERTLTEKEYDDLRFGEPGAEISNVHEEVWVLPITKEMRESVLKEGNKQFKIGGLITKQKNFQNGGLNMARTEEEVYSDTDDQMDMMGFQPQNEMFDPVSGNEVPLGGTSEGVRDNIDVKMSEGEMVIPEYAVNYHGVESYVNSIQNAKKGYSQMQNMGLVGNPDEATMEDTEALPKMDTKDTPEFQFGGLATAQLPTIPTPTITEPITQDISTIAPLPPVSTQPTPVMSPYPSGYFIEIAGQPNMFKFVAPPGQQNTLTGTYTREQIGSAPIAPIGTTSESVYGPGFQTYAPSYTMQNIPSTGGYQVIPYTNAAGNTIYMTSVNGQIQGTIPIGYSPSVEEAVPAPQMQQPVQAPVIAKQPPITPGGPPGGPPSGVVGVAAPSVTPATATAPTARATLSAQQSATVSSIRNRIKSQGILGGDVISQADIAAETAPDVAIHTTAIETPIGDFSYAELGEQAASIALNLVSAPPVFGLLSKLGRALAFAPNQVPTAMMQSGFIPGTGFDPASGWAVFAKPSIFGLTAKVAYNKYDTTAFKSVSAVYQQDFAKSLALQNITKDFTGMTITEIGESLVFDGNGNLTGSTAPDAIGTDDGMFLSDGTFFSYKTMKNSALSNMSAFKSMSKEAKAHTYALRDKAFLGILPSDDAMSSGEDGLAEHAKISTLAESMYGLKAKDMKAKIATLTKTNLDNSLKAKTPYSASYAEMSPLAAKRVAYQKNLNALSGGLTKGQQVSRSAHAQMFASEAAVKGQTNLAGPALGPGLSGVNKGGTGRSSGLSTGFSGQTGGFCWVARKVYGEDNPKWQIFRSWLCTQAPKWLYKAYGKYGERFAEWLDGKERTQKIIRKWMDKRIQKYLDTQPKTAQEIGPL